VCLTSPGGRPQHHFPSPEKSPVNCFSLSFPGLRRCRGYPLEEFFFLLFRIKSSENNLIHRKFFVVFSTPERNWSFPFFQGRKDSSSKALLPPFSQERTIPCMIYKAFYVDSRRSFKRPGPPNQGILSFRFLRQDPPPFPSQVSPQMIPSGVSSTLDKPRAVWWIRISLTPTIPPPLVSHYGRGLYRTVTHPDAASQTLLPFPPYRYLRELSVHSSHSSSLLLITPVPSGA